MELLEGVYTSINRESTVLTLHLTYRLLKYWRKGPPDFPEVQRLIQELNTKSRHALLFELDLSDGKEARQVEVVFSFDDQQIIPIQILTH